MSLEINSNDLVWVGCSARPIVFPHVWSFLFLKNFYKIVYAFIIYEFILIVNERATIKDIYLLY